MEAGRQAREPGGSVSASAAGTATRRRWSGAPRDCEPGVGTGTCAVWARPVPAAASATLRTIDPSAASVRSTKLL